MAGFNVLDRALNLERNYFLEASAGTGKSFAIEHLFVRLLLEKEDISLDKILVVTFTKAATQELKRRIRSTLEKTLHYLEIGEGPDFIQPLLQKGANALYLLKKKLLRTLALFDEVKIFTIHGFCYSTLTEELEGKTEENRKQTTDYLRDFFRTELTHLCTPSQLDKLLRHYREIDRLIRSLVTLLLRKAPILAPLDMQEIKHSIVQMAEELQEADFALLTQDLEAFAALYKGMCYRDGTLKEEVREELLQLEKFQLQDPFSYTFLSQMTPDKRLSKKKAPTFHYPHLLHKIETLLIPALHKGLHSDYLFAFLAAKAALHIEKVLEKENILVTEDILLTMEKKISDPVFVSSIQNSYKAVLIDEFQDTDRIQWKIFKKLFIEGGKIPVFLIGDPKQSIYRFRGGDIYTYFQAKKEFKEAFHGELICNFRSDPSLVVALNALFSLLSPFQVLPHTEEPLLYSNVTADPQKEDFGWKDAKKALHFFEADREEEIFAACIEEIKYLHQEYQFPYRACAVLVNDRYQAERFHIYAKKQGLHALSKKSRPLTESRAFEALTELLEGVLYYKKESAFVQALAGTLFSFPYTSLEEEKKKWIAPFSKLKEVLEKEGILPFFKELMEKYGLSQNLFMRPQGSELYFDLLQLCEIIAQEDERGVHCLSALKNLPLVGSEDESIQAHSFDLEEAVPILTIHGSKGLEFEIVLVPGLITPLQEVDGLLFDPEKRVFCFDASIREREKEELIAERLRLFYVAATRAKKRLYLPLLRNDTQSIMAIFCTKSGLKEKFSELPFSISSAQENMYFTTHTEKNRTLELSFSSLPPLHIEPQPMYSFSRLAISSSIEKKSPSPSDLPLGIETGLLLHKILEKIPWQALTKASSLQEMEALVVPFVEGSVYAPFIQPIASQMLALFQAPLPVTPSFCLQAVDPSKIFREMDFLYYSEDRKCYLKGVMDLLFEYNQKLYLVDWKSNYLESYDPAALKKEMQSQDYFLQKEIYYEGLKKYSKLYSLAMGGCFYIFLRAPDIGKGHGMLFFS